MTLLEMAFAGNCGLNVNLPPSMCSSSYGPIGTLFAEELGLVMEVVPTNVDAVMKAFSAANVPVLTIGRVTKSPEIIVSIGDTVVLQESNNPHIINICSFLIFMGADMTELRDVWESTSFALELLQCSPSCVAQERDNLSKRTGIPYSLSFEVKPTPEALLLASSKHKVAVIRQEGSNGDREMLSALYAAGLDAWDVNMRDLLSGAVELSSFKGIVFCGGFSYADVNDSAKGAFTLTPLNLLFFL